MSKVTFEPFQKVLVRDFDHNEWHINFFERKCGNYFLCFSGNWKQCLPYEGNEHLLGTTNDPTLPEPEFKWGDHIEVCNKEIQLWAPAIYTGRDKYGVFAVPKGERFVQHWDYCRRADW